jgi:hypothetical protein
MLTPFASVNALPELCFVASPSNSRKYSSSQDY